MKPVNFSGQGSASPVPRVNAMTVDVEDYFQVAAFKHKIADDDWQRWPCRVEENTERILELFDRKGVHATFFTLGWVAERYPELVRRIAEAGHEVASHGLRHVKVTEQTPSQFHDDVTRTKMLLEDITGLPVNGYRAASFSIGASNLWALDVLNKAGYHYSSSIYPVHHDHYGMPDAPRFPFRMQEGELMEIPISTVDVFGKKLPCGGGGYFRLLPYSLSRWAIQRVNQRDQRPSVFYFHPWELDPGQPRIPDAGLKSRFRHYVNLDKMERRLSRLLGDFSWDRMDKVFPHA